MLRSPKEQADLSPAHHPQSRRMPWTAPVIPITDFDNLSVP